MKGKSYKIINSPIDQYIRTEKIYLKLVEIDRGLQPSLNSGECIDLLYNFFINCHHIRYWISNDSSTGSLLKKKLKSFGNKSEVLRICEELANRLKHFRPDRNKVSQNTRIDSFEIVEVTIGDRKVFVPKYTVISSDKTYDALKLATECIKEWESFLKENKINSETQ